MPANKRSRGPTAALALLTATPALAAVALGAAPVPGGHAAPQAPIAQSTAQPRARIDATTDAEARQMRHATHRLANELDAAARCDARRPPQRFAPCVAPALRHAGIGGRTTAILLRGVITPLRTGPCRTYLLGLEAANDASADNARWLLPLLYQTGRRQHQHQIMAQLALNAAMLHRALGTAPDDVCSPVADGPAS
jgi:hypothetical protein